MDKKRSLHILIFLAILATVLIGNVSSSAALPISNQNLNQTSPDHLNLIILVKASKSSNGPINNLDTNPKTQLQVIQNAVTSLFTTYQFPPNVNIGITAYGHKFIRDYDKSCREDNVETVIPLQPFSQSIDLVPFTSISGLGDAPTTIALAEASKNFPQSTSPNTLNAILLIADNADSCGGKPEEEAKVLAERQGIVIYTIGFRVNNNTSTELQAIADQANGEYYSVPAFISASQRATNELTGLLIKVLDNLLSGISAPIPATASITPTTISLTSPATPEAISTTAIPLSTATNLPTSVPPVEIADNTGNWLTGGVLLVVSLGLVIFVVFAFLYLKSHRTNTQVIEKIIENKIQTPDSQKTGENITKVERVDISTIDLDAFLQDVYENYIMIGQSGKYIPLESLKRKLSSKYQGQFDQLLIMARQKYPSKIWIDKNADSQTIVKIVL